jgi:predicted TIM-barrel fold metal-dependent hydrolase
VTTQIATRIIDGDGHLFEDMEAIRQALELPYRDLVRGGGGLFPPFDHMHSAKAVQTPPQRDGRPENPGPEGWMRFLTDAGIDWTVLYPTYALAHGKIVSLDYAVAICRAYNDWLAATYVKRDRRFVGMAILPLQDPPEAAKELRRAVTELGFMGAVFPSNGLAQPLGHKVYWPVYEEANRLGCCLAVHGSGHDRIGLDHMNMYVPVHALAHPWGLALHCSNILYNGIFERFPKVRMAFLEGGIAWLLMLVERLHASHETHFQYIPPGEFGIRENVDPAKVIKELIAADRFYLGIETEEVTMAFALKLLGNRSFLYSSDFPHEVTLESCKYDIASLMESDEITEEDKAALLYANAERFYQLKP